MVLIDTNVFVYAEGRDHPLRAPCRALLAQVGAGTLDATTDTEVVQEILHVYDRRGRRQDGLDIARDVLAAFPAMLSVTPVVMARAADLMAARADLGARDALHAASALEHGLDGIISADRGLEGVPGIRRIDPASFRTSP